MAKTYHLRIGPNEKHDFSLPSKWVAAHFVESEETTPALSVKQLTGDALARSTGAPLFNDSASGSKRVAIIVDDATRPTPVAEILNVLLARLADIGYSRANTSIVVACGTHVAMEREAVTARLGAEVVSAYEVVQHNAWQADLVPIKIPDGRVVRVNPAVARADVRIGISSILPHPMAGYGGGPKIVMPGVCDFEFIMKHHMKHTIHPRSKAAVVRGNPFHEDCMGIAQAIGLDLSINCIYDQQGQIAAIVAGGLKEAFAEAVEMCSEKLGYRFSEKVDVAITSSYPHTHGIQFYKGLTAPDAITKSTGAILVVAPLVSAMPEDFINSFRKVREESHDNPSAYVRGFMSKGMPFLPEKPAEFNMAMSSAVLRPPIRTILVSPLVSPEAASIVGLEYASSVEEGLSKLEVAYPQARVAIFPSGGLIVPITTWEQ